ECVGADRPVDRPEEVQRAEPVGDGGVAAGGEAQGAGRVERGRGRDVQVVPGAQRDVRPGRHRGEADTGVDRQVVARPPGVRGGRGQVALAGRVDGECERPAGRRQDGRRARVDRVADPVEVGDRQRPDVVDDDRRAGRVVVVQGRDVRGRQVDAGRGADGQARGGDRPGAGDAAGGGGRGEEPGAGAGRLVDGDIVAAHPDIPATRGELG